MYMPSSVHVAVSTAVLAILLPAAQVLGQEPSSARLSTDVVAQLVAAPDSPEARARLAGHFTALGEEYDAQAREHRAMADAYRKASTPSESKRPGAPDTALHGERLAAASSRAAAEARTLATSHAAMGSAMSKAVSGH